jgi:hypothetical protein
MYYYHLCYVNEVSSIFLINISVFKNISIISPIFLALDVKHLRYSIEYYPLTENNEPQGISHSTNRSSSSTSIDGSRICDTTTGVRILWTQPQSSQPPQPQQ